MIDARTIDWLVKLVTSFDEMGFAGKDFFYLIKTMLMEQRISFNEMLSSAAQGVGTRVHEGLEFVLEEDLDHPDEFDGVVFVIGEYESSILPIADYVYLIELLCRSYLLEFPSEESRILANLDRVRSRYFDATNSSEPNEQ
ncbi:hypothetical protein [Pseudoduganella sp. R-43]|uniref:hypothetical protein n=1 Tax=unclassified Pseudoduganella TaxID=2637179 RepID=UPI003CE6D87C